MPSLVIHVEENVYKNINNPELEDVEHNLIQVLIKELEAEKKNVK